MRRLVPLLALLLLAGCGSTSVHHHSAPPCHPRTPPALGECISQHFGKPKPTAVHAQCADWSQWQGYEPPTYGLSCVIIQSNYGLHSEPSVWSQIHDAERHGVACGLYSFMEGAPGGAEARVADSIYKRSGCHLGIWADAEIGAAYSHVGGYIYEAHRLGDLAGLYSAPGMYEGGYQGGYLWPAEWGGSVYAFGGYPYSAIKLVQVCGTCFRGGTETDLDADYGLIALGHPETESERRARKTRELHAAERTLTALRGRILVLRRVLLHYGCIYRFKHHRHYGPRCNRWRHEGGSAHARGRRLDSLIAKRHREGIY